MATLTGITATPSTITSGQTSLITVAAAPSSTVAFDIQAKSVPDGAPMDVTVTVNGAPVVFTTNAATAQPGNILVTASGGTLTPVAGSPGSFTFTPPAS